MNARKVVELGFADEILYIGNEDEYEIADGVLFSRAMVVNSIVNKLSKKESKTSIESLYKRLSLLNH